MIVGEAVRRGRLSEGRACGIWEVNEQLILELYVPVFLLIFMKSVSWQKMHAIP